MARDTARIAEPIAGEALYQARARFAFPLLVRQAEVGKPITYSDLAEELGIPNARNLNYVLGSIGRTMENLSKAWKEKIPPIQCLVVKKDTGIPGEGVGPFVPQWGDFAALPRRRQREIVAGAHAQIFAYPRWEEVLKAVSLHPVIPNFSNVVREASQPSRGNGGGGGESDRHRDLKTFVAQNPMCIGLPSSTLAGNNEVPLPSGDCLDVSFRVGDEWVAAEVKSSLSNSADVVRGLFQCVKYRAVMAAAQAAEGLARDARAVLVLEGKLGQELIPLRNILGVEVFEEVSPKPSR